MTDILEEMKLILVEDPQEGYRGYFNLFPGLVVGGDTSEDVLEKLIVLLGDVIKYRVKSLSIGTQIYTIQAS